MHLECKRPQAVAGLEQAIRTAEDQLEVRARVADDRPIFGMIALAIGKMVHHGERMLVAESDADARRMIEAATRQFIQQTDHVWQQRESPAVGGMLVSFSGLVHVRDVDLWARIMWLKGSFV